MNEPSQLSYEFGPFSLDAGKRLLLRNGEPVPADSKSHGAAPCADRASGSRAHERRAAQAGLGRHDRGRGRAHPERLRSAQDPGREAGRPSVHRHRASQGISVRGRGTRKAATGELAGRAAAATSESRWTEVGPFGAWLVRFWAAWLRSSSRLSRTRHFLAEPRPPRKAPCSPLQRRHVTAHCLPWTPPRTTPCCARGISASGRLTPTPRLRSRCSNAPSRSIPRYARAYADLAAAYVTRLTFVTPEKTGDLEQKAFAAAEKALLLDPGLPEAYMARGDLLWTHSHHFAHERATQEFRRAVELNPEFRSGPQATGACVRSSGVFRGGPPARRRRARDKPQQRAGAEFSSAGPPVDGQG